MTRARSSPAALRVKVRASNSSGASTRANRVRKRASSTEVLPEPAGASRWKLPRGSRACSRAA